MTEVPDNQALPRRGPEGRTTTFSPDGRVRHPRPDVERAHIAFQAGHVKTCCFEANWRAGRRGVPLTPAGARWGEYGGPGRRASHTDGPRCPRPVTFIRRLVHESTSSRTSAHARVAG